MKYVLVSKDLPWSEYLNEELSKKYDRNFVWYKNSNLLSLSEFLKQVNPEYVFFFHWSEIVSDDVFNRYKCIVLHTSNLPDGKGGSPLQNQILDGIVSTQVNALDMVSDLDSGDIYCSSPITLQGTINEIYFAIAKVSLDLIGKCISGVKPKPQKSGGKIYKRNKKNTIDFNQDLISIHNTIRMLDGDGYENAHVELGNYRLTFNRSKLNYNKSIISDVKITRKN